MDKTQRIRSRDMEKAEAAEPLYIAFDDLDFSFYPAEVKSARQLWNAGAPLADIAVKLGREIEETFILLYDLSTKGQINRRPNGLMGEA